MEVHTLTPSQIKKNGLEALIKSLGRTGAVRFLWFFETGKGDYTQDRKKLLSNTKVCDIIKEVKNKRKNK